MTVEGPRDRGPLLPGARIGVLGSGQLGRMFALAARAMGYRIWIYSPDGAPPAGPVADQEFVADYLDLDRIRAFAGEVDVITFEFENIPAAATNAAAERVPVRPAGQVLHLTQNRLREKTFLQENGFPVAPFHPVRSRSDLDRAFEQIGLPGVLKTADFGYDGKGQVRVREPAQAEDAWASLGGAEGIYEQWVAFEKEVSVVAARTVQGEFAAFPLFENTHVRQILDVTFAPATVPPRLAEEARELASALFECLEVVGVLTVELFLTADGGWLVNELAPRTHNSGHLTIDAAVTSQFEQQARAVCGLPLGSVELHRPAAMANLLGDLWENGEPNWAAALADPKVKLHLYGKAQPRIGRKMGHLTGMGATVEEAVERVGRARGRLG